MPERAETIQMPATGFRSSDFDPNAKQLDGNKPPRSTMNPVTAKLNPAPDRLRMTTGFV
jgi:hypothetical protein